ncbi:Actin- protein 6 [Cichlidogyrus casuarinus]|uniref:Actin- protein 6 n=1 Tax=Cichlidogyrus casuarinus TaxID=1844966 RepID=A0ABD2QKY0_9PLAT
MKKPPVLILDLGGGSIKVGLNSSSEALVADNAIYKAKNVSSRIFIGSEIKDCQNISSLFQTLPFKKGYINNWDTQRQILDSIFKQFLNTDSLDGVDLICTEPYFNFTSSKETMNEIFFEEYSANALIRANPAFLSAYKYKQEYMRKPSRYTLVIDSGYSFTHVVPMLDGKPMRDYIKRFTVGGKILTNRLIEMISYRQLDVRSEVYIMNQCKEAACYVSTNFEQDLRIARKRNPNENPVMREYVLPDYVDVHRGFLREPIMDKTKQNCSLLLTNERFTVPELIFYPGDIGFPEMGLSEGLDYILNELVPQAARPGLLANCVITGGNAMMEGFSARCFQELRKFAPDDLRVDVFKPENRQNFAWEGGQLLAKHIDVYNQYRVSRHDYYEHGNNLCEERFPVS